jgi:hypothetical protein
MNLAYSLMLTVLIAGMKQMNVDITPHSAGATEDQIKNMERQIGVSLPSDYRKFMALYNGGQILIGSVFPEFQVTWSGKSFGFDRSSVSYVYTLNRDINFSWHDAFLTLVKDQQRIPKDTIPIAHDRGSNQILLGVGESNFGKIYLWLKDYASIEDDIAPNYDNVGLIANSFTEFLQKLHRPSN